MPELSRFLGIIIAMYYRESRPGSFSRHLRRLRNNGRNRIWSSKRRFSEAGASSCDRVAGTAPHRIARGLILGPREPSSFYNRSIGVKPMLPRVVDGRYVSGYTVWLRFSDGVEGEIDLAAELHGPIFEPLRNIEYFRRFLVHPELGTLVWPNGADFAPEFLRASLRVAA